MSKTSSGRKCKNGIRSFTEGKERKKWDLRGTCDDTSQKNIVPTEGESCEEKKRETRDDKDYGL
jgi:hypothetical protein